jgi:hypothetical protein
MPQDALEIEVKRLDSIEIKGGDEEGHVEAVIATLNVVDRDHDVILPGAIKDGAHVTLSDYGHSTVISGTLPVGKGTLQTKGNKVVFKGRYFMSTDREAEAFRTIQEMGRRTRSGPSATRSMGTRYRTPNCRRRARGGFSPSWILRGEPGDSGRRDRNAHRLSQGGWS